MLKKCLSELGGSFEKWPLTKIINRNTLEVCLLFYFMSCLSYFFQKFSVCLYFLNLHYCNEGSKLKLEGGELAPAGLHTA